MSQPAKRVRLLGLVLLLVVVGAGAVVWQGRSGFDPIDALVLEENRKATTRRRAELYATGRYDEDGFVRMGPPQPGEWLWVHPETGQTFEDYLHTGPLRKTKERPEVVLQPLTPLRPHAQSALEAVKEFTGIFFDAPCRLAEPEPLPPHTYTESRGQYLSDEILNVLASKKPSTAMVYAGVADKDFYTRSLANFVFGVGRLRSGIGVYSFYRFHHPGVSDRLYLTRGLQLLNHEIGHTFGLNHCIYYRCSMNGSNSLSETDEAPVHFCPVCLRKLQESLGFDVKERYRELAAFYAKHGMTDEAAWVAARIAHLEAQGKTTFW